MLTERTLLSEFGPDHPRVDVVRDKIRVIQEYLDTNRPADAANQEIKQM